MAEAANQQGNAFYRERKYTKAQQRFEVASQLDPKEPKYPSNLSAVQYEAGRYPQAITLIRQSWNLLRAQNAIDGKPSTPPAADPLAMKLSTRFAKASSHGFYNNSVSLNTKIPDDALANQRETDADIDKFVLSESPGEDDEKIKDMKAAWQQWRTIRDNCAHHDLNDRQKEIAAAEIRLRSTPIFKSSADPTLEYYTFGHDDVRSLMGGINSSDDCSLDSPEYRDQKAWSFLLGGSGDARHIFGTLVHLAAMADKLGSLDDFHIHMTLMDVHPASLARVIVVMSLLRQIFQTRFSKDTAKRQELYTALFYLYNTMLMPDYCHQVVIDTAKALVDELPKRDNSLSKYLHVNEKSLFAIIDVLKYWSTPLPKSAKVLLQTSLASESQYDIDDSMASFLGPNTPKAQLKAASMKNRMAGGDIYNDPEAEQKIFKHTMALIPPKSLLSRHPALAKLANSYLSASDSLYAAVRTEVEQTWKPNPTIFDKYSTEHPDHCDGAVGYPAVGADAFDSIIPFATFVQKFQKGPPPAFCRGGTGFAVTTQFFELVVDAIWTIQNNLKLEIVVSDVIMGTAKLLAGELGNRPKDFPSRYSRIWLSNVPDYTNGIINNAVHLAPYLEDKGLVMSNCLLNTGNWPSVADYCYNYTLLRPDDVPRILGCKVLNPYGHAWDDIVIQQMKLPRPFENLASKQELHTWFAHLLVCILCSAIPPTAPNKVEMPNNLGAFIHVLVHLHRVGFPPHWIGDFMQSVLSDQLVTAAMPYVGKLPIPMSESYKKNASRKLNLAPWQAGLQVILALTKDALPFSVNLPHDFPATGDIHTYTATVQSVDLRHDLRIMSSGALSTPFSPTIGMLFYQPMQNRTPTELTGLIPAVLEGNRNLADVKMQIILSQEHVDLSQGKVSWKMSKSWYEKMKSENWAMVLYRTDFKVVVIKPLAAKQWLEVL